MSIGGLIAARATFVHVAVTDDRASDDKVIKRRKPC
jgi:hypothetical protein